MTVAARNFVSFRNVSSFGAALNRQEQEKKCHQCNHHYFSYDTVHCKGCKQAYCHACLSNRYAVNPAEVAQEKNWKCYFCLKICNCPRRGCRSSKNIRAEPEHPFSLKDFNENYYLGYGLTYSAVSAEGHFIHSYVDNQSLLGITRSLRTDKAKVEPSRVSVPPFFSNSAVVLFD